MSDLPQYCGVAEEFVACVATAIPEMHKVKIHLLLHLPSNLVEFGPAANCNTERHVRVTMDCDLYHNLWKWSTSHRCESLNSILRAFNVYGNRQAPSRDIGRAFTTLFVLQTLASSESNDAEK